MNKNDKNSFENYEKRIEKEFENSTIFNSNTSSDNAVIKHKKNNKYIKLICILLCFLLVTCGSIFGIVKFWPKEEKIDNTDNEPEKTISLTADANIELSKMKNASKNAISNVIKLVVKNEKNTFVCLPYKSTVTYNGEETDEVYYRLKDSADDIPVDDTLVTAFYDELFSITAISELKGDWTEKDCGLDKPKVLITATMADNTQFTVKIGNKVATSDGYYYICTSLKDGIYICDGSVYDNYSVSYKSLINTTLFDALTENEADSKYFQNNKLIMYDKIELNGDNFDNVKLSYKVSNDDTMRCFIDEPVKTYASDEQLEILLKPISDGLTASGVYKIKPDQNDLKKYGLDNPFLSIKYTIDGKNYNIKFSKPGLIDNNYCACMVNDVPIIYNILCSQVEFVDWSMNNLRYNLLYLKNIETIKSLTTIYNGKSYKYVLSFDKVAQTTDNYTQNGTTQATTTSEELSVVLNSTPIDADNFKTAYQRLVITSATKYLEKGESVKGSPTLTFEIKLKNGKTDKITYTKYNENYYSYKLNGIGDELIPARTVEALITNFERLRNGEEVISPNNQQ